MTETGGEREEKKKKNSHSFIPPSLPSSLWAPVFRVYGEQGNKEHLSQSTFVRSVRQFQTSMKYISRSCNTRQNHYKCSVCLLHTVKGVYRGGGG